MITHLRTPNMNYRGKNRQAEKRHLVEEERCREQKKASKLQEDTASMKKKKCPLKGILREQKVLVF